MRIIVSHQYKNATLNLPFARGRILAMQNKHLYDGIDLHGVTL